MSIWDDETVSGYDMIKEEAELTEKIAQEYAESTEILEPTEEKIEETIEASSYDLDKEEATVVYNARIRLEQAKLYEMIIDHDLFSGVNADPRAIEIVKNEIKHYIVKRLEILMGLRQPVRQVEKKQESPLNDIEIDFLKALAFKGTRGRSAQQQTLEEEPVVEKRHSLNPIVSKNRQNKQLKTLPSTVKKTPNTQYKSEIIRGKKKNPKKQIPEIRSGLKVRDLTEEEATLLAKKDIAEMANRKPFHEMTLQEKEEEVKRVNEKYKKKKITGPVPFPTTQQLEMQYLQQQAKRGYDIRNPLNSAMANIANNIIKNRLKK